MVHFIFLFGYKEIYLLDIQQPLSGQERELYIPTLNKLIVFPDTERMHGHDV